MSFTRLLPFCPLEVNETQFTAWNNKNRWLGPLTLQQVITLFYNHKQAVTSVSGTGILCRVAPWTWDGSKWTTPQGTPVTINWPATTDTYLGRRGTVGVTGPENFPCPTGRDNGPTSNQFLNGDSRLYYTIASNITFFGGFVLGGAVLSAPNGLVRRSSTDEYYVGYTFSMRFQLDPAQFPIVPANATTPPPPAQAYGTPSIGVVDPRWAWGSSASAGAGNQPTVNFTILGFAGSHNANSLDSPPLPSTASATITLTDPTDLFP